MNRKTITRTTTIAPPSPINSIGLRPFDVLVFVVVVVVVSVVVDVVVVVVVYVSGAVRVSSRNNERVTQSNRIRLAGIVFGLIKN